ncbi:MAG: VWA domain-containing protein [Nocardioidaceae bacterium]|nr:VWA domain-containing protein [Nocardioidaceae bacterium]MCL2612811.1 VWA domain-containing protein [Nocardioidaceae bacterium]
MTVLERGGDEILVGFATALREAGVAVTSDRTRSYLEATALLGVADREATRSAGHATLCAGPDDLHRHDRVFEEWFSTDTGGGALRARPRPAAASPRLLPDELRDHAPGDGDVEEQDAVHAAASAREVLRQRDVATLSPAERRELAAMFATLPVVLPRRSAARRTPQRRGEVDMSRTLRSSLRRLGEPARIERRRRGSRVRRVVLLVDVSGSMSGYADALLRLAHRVVTGAPGGAGRVEVFSLGTRLTRLTSALRLRDPERALAAAGDVVPDWSGGTRLGETLRAFLQRWGQRGMARGSVVVVLSDGWERGDPAPLADAMARLHLLAHRVVWANPHRGKTGYEPIQGGVVAVLPYVDDFLAGHSMATFAELMEVLRSA